MFSLVDMALYLFIPILPNPDMIVRMPLSAGSLIIAAIRWGLAC
jgi:hypothetical protein